MRDVRLTRTTAETDIALRLNLDGSGKSQIDTSVKFFDHMLTLFAAHGGFDLDLKAVGDGVDTHHVIEDIGILLGDAFAKALGDKKGIARYGFTYLPMDESLCRICVDISGRPTLVYHVKLTREFIGDFECEMLKEFLIAFSNNAKITLHVENLYGHNNHHIVEGIFKGLGRAMAAAVKINADDMRVPSTKGVL